MLKRIMIIILVITATMALTSCINKESNTSNGNPIGTNEILTTEESTAPEFNPSESSQSFVEGFCATENTEEAKDDETEMTNTQKSDEKTESSENNAGGVTTPWG